MFCSKCGKENSNEAIFCSKCGYKMTDKEPDNNETTSSEMSQTSTIDSNNNQSTKKMTLGCGSGCLLIILISIILSYCSFKSYTIVSKDNNTIVAEATIRYSFTVIMTDIVSETVWKLSTKYKNYNNIVINFSIKGKSQYGEEKISVLEPYILTTEDIKEVTKYKDRNSYQLGSGKTNSFLYLFKNGFGDCK